jgi:hypothetical protein
MNLYELDKLNQTGKLRLNNKKLRECFFAKIEDKISKNKDKEGLIDMLDSPKTGLFKFSEGGKSIVPLMINFASADKNQINRILKKSIAKFSAKRHQNQINIVLLIERSSSCRRVYISQIIKIKKSANPSAFKMISEIYHLAIWRKTGIARVYPSGRIMESIFFPPEKFIEKNQFLRNCIDYFK